MSGLDNLRDRNVYYGGVAQQDRMVRDKLHSLKWALLYSYQSMTAILPDGREFRALMNPSKLNVDYDTKEISIPFKDRCLNPRSPETQEIGLKGGDVFVWKENNTHWIVYLQALEEIAYFRAEVRRCDYQIEVEGIPYWVYVQGPTETKINWNSKDKKTWNDLNYSLEMMITKDEVTERFFHRFSVIKFRGKNYEVSVADSVMGNGVIQLQLKETFNNTIEDRQKEQQKIEQNQQPQPTGAYIKGANNVDIYTKNIYEIIGASGGTWSVNNDKILILESDDSSVTLGIDTARSGSFVLTYTIDETNKFTTEIKINSF